MSQLNYLSRGFLKLICIKFKFIKPQMNPRKLSYILFLRYMIASLQRKQVKTKDLQNPWNSTGLKSLQNLSNANMKNFWKKEIEEMNIKIIKRS